MSQWSMSSVKFCFYDRAQRTKRVKALGARPLFIQGLVIAGADVIEKCVSGNVRTEVGAVS